jgi:hypothetical protein
MNVYQLYNKLFLKQIRKRFLIQKKNPSIITMTLNDFYIIITTSFFIGIIFTLIFSL